MSLLRYDPFAATRDLDRLFDEITRQADRPWIPRVDIFETEDQLSIRVEVPGMNPDDIDVTVEDSTLVISGRRAFESEDESKTFHRREIARGEFRRMIYLPDEYDTENISAEYHDGILEISLPKRPEVLPKKVKVQVNK